MCNSVIGPSILLQVLPFVAASDWWRPNAWKMSLDLHLIRLMNTPSSSFFPLINSNHRHSGILSSGTYRCSWIWSVGLCFRLVMRAVESIIEILDLILTSFLIDIDITCRQTIINDKRPITFLFLFFVFGSAQCLKTNVFFIWRDVRFFQTTIWLNSLRSYFSDPYCYVLYSIKLE